jgi:hypothetical protein
MIFGYYHVAADLSSRAHNGFRGAVEGRKMRAWPRRASGPIS